MKLYKITVAGDEFTTQVAWRGTQADSKAKAKEYRNDYSGVADVTAAIEEIDFPTDKPGLLRWLNENFRSDNG